MRYCKKTNQDGFTLTELIVVIGVMVILIAMMIPNIIGYMRKATKTRFEADARVLMNAAQASVALANTYYDEEFDYAIKYNHDGIPMGRFTNLSLAEYIENGGYDPTKTNQAKSKRVDMYIAKDMLDVFRSANGYEFGRSIIGKTTKEISGDPGTYGTFAFAFAYSPEGALLYFYAVRDNYCFYMNNMEGQAYTKVVDVSDSFSIPSYPDTSDKTAAALAGGW